MLNNGYNSCGREPRTGYRVRIQTYNNIGEVRMKRTNRAALIGLLLFPALCLAHGPSRQKVVEKIDINAPPNKVWNLISNFCSISKWDPEITACTSDKGTTPNSIRTITLKNGAKVQEQLVRIFPDKHVYQYMMVKPNPKAFPINTHGSKITVADNGKGGSTVTWWGAFYRSYPGPTPPPELSDAAGRKAISALYRAGLEHLKELAEKH